MNYVDEINPAELMDKSIKSMLADLDPYTNYYNEQDVIKARINQTGEYTGIGAVITRKEDKAIIKEAFKNYPADKAGLKAGDEIIQIGDVSLSDFKNDVSELMKGSKNTKIDVLFFIVLLFFIVFLGLRLPPTISKLSYSLSAAASSFITASLGSATSIGSATSLGSWSPPLFFDFFIFK